MSRVGSGVIVRQERKRSPSNLPVRHDDDVNLVCVRGITIVLSPTSGRRRDLFVIKVVPLLFSTKQNITFGTGICTVTGKGRAYPKRTVYTWVYFYFHGGRDLRVKQRLSSR